MIVIGFVRRFAALSDHDHGDGAGRGTEPTLFMIKRGFEYETPYESPLDHGRGRERARERARR
jgi:hypothetical protein